MAFLFFFFLKMSSLQFLYFLHEVRQPGLLKNPMHSWMFIEMSEWPCQLDLKSCLFLSSESVS